MESPKEPKEILAITHQYPKSSPSPGNPHGHGGIPSRTTTNSKASKTPRKDRAKHYAPYPSPHRRAPAKVKASKIPRKDRAQNYTPSPTPHKKKSAGMKASKTPRRDRAKHYEPYPTPHKQTPTRSKFSRSKIQVGGRSRGFQDKASPAVEAIHIESEKEERAYDGDDEDGWNFLDGDSSSMRRRIKRFYWRGRVFLGRKLDRVGKFLGEY
ncbi:hypothetical protein C7212DRAFT_361370 [Tuber magnatum]|uniref:Uncharacterized protein n=1 Tax=Tuber magnatum TaxID=42249 RepID=A0A317T2A9_9PEZI|nr:hypothetical protein C7212DRAFT_361370 [Tuber magnatum]